MTLLRLALRSHRNSLLMTALVVATGAGAIGNRTIGATGVGGMLVGTVLGVLVIPGLYYLFARISDGRKLLRDAADEPLSELLEHSPLPEDTSE